MNKKLFGLIALVAFGGALTSCDTDVETIDVQKPFEYSEQYYQNLRDYKQSKHEVAYAYYAFWAPLEGVDGYKDPASMGERIIGLPDSIDIVNLWMGIPTPEEHPIAYKDMVQAQTQRGTRFVMHADASHYRHKFTVDGVDYDMGGNVPDDEMMDAYARWIRSQVDNNGLDGVDIDFEGWNQSSLLKLVTLLGEYYGPMGSNPEKLLIVDYFNTTPNVKNEPYVDYFVQQAYSKQNASPRFISGVPSEKMIFVDAFDEGHGPSGARILDYARVEPADGGNKGGCGAYYIEYNYASTSGIPYNEYRKAIQIMNPAVH